MPKDCGRSSVRSGGGCFRLSGSERQAGSGDSFCGVFFSGVFRRQRGKKNHGICGFDGYRNHRHHRHNHLRIRHHICHYKEHRIHRRSPHHNNLRMHRRILPHNDHHRTHLQSHLHSMA